MPALLALEDGSVFRGQSIGSRGTTVGEVVFNTAMTGYQEILTDPSYARQIVTLTYPQIGNTGVNQDDVESDRVWCAGLVIRQTPRRASSWRQQQTLPEYLAAEGVVAIEDVDTRRLTRLIREKGALAGCIRTATAAIAEIDVEAALAEARAFPGLKGMDLAKVVTRAEPMDWEQTAWDLEAGFGVSFEPRLHVVAYDFGVKRNILRLLASRGCRVTVVPATTPADAALAYGPDGIFLSNGPGDPEPCAYAIAAIKQLLDCELPIFGICLGHQLLALASGAKTVKMPHGHHGANHPVQDLASKRVIITSQNHGFAVDEASLPNCLEATHASLFDGTLQGIRRTDRPAFGFQGHPEASPGPQDCTYLFDQFVELMESRRA
ncbi:MAG: glutamine-hydrolyzing carbamoyl-phosphate synthase small subunit [Gammaproteobacteria bacterium]|nr:glutamine-hydrolyzing carbamoyl-phosphate synthase small subunit [Gammaproteobacteria bacterium]